MKLYTEKELLKLLENSDNAEDLTQLADYVFKNRFHYGNFYAKIQLGCIKKLPSVSQYKK